MTLNYLPLWPSETTRNYTLELHSKELGIFPYTIQAIALPPPNEATLQVSCDLGLSTVTNVQLRNPTIQSVVFECTVSLYHKTSLIKLIKNCLNPT